MSHDSFVLKRQPIRPRIELHARLLLVLVALLLLLQFIAPYKGWVVLIVGFGGALLIGYLWARSLARGLRLSREVRFGWAQVGDRFEERFTLVNQGWAPALWLEVIDHSTLPGYEAGRGTGVGGRSRVHWRAEAICKRRGLFCLGPTTVIAGDPFGLYTVRLHYPASLPFLVMPPIIPLPAIQVAAGGRGGEGRPRPHALERAISASSVREYLPGDSPRWVHWRTCARRDALFVRLFDGTPANDWWVVLDMDRRVQVGEGEGSTEEHGVILAASMADQGLRLGRAVGLAAHGEDMVWFPPARGEDTRWEILRALALLSPGSLSLKELLDWGRLRMSRYAGLVIITPAVEGDWIEALVPLLNRGAVPTVLLLDPASFGGSRTSRSVAGVLTDLGIVHYIITRDMFDRPEARPGVQGRVEWRVVGHGKPIAIRQTFAEWQEVAG